ncbi:DUF1648 domain-containing protein [Clostridium sp. WILCCON 0269]|uniref:DUF1648 domain-containing protein n=1 Tax=Candidatus Clostridium eludens TaxID=3381663 RepID=A0ABW8SQ16_9CLOT
MKERPKLKIPYSTYEIVMELFSAVAILVNIGLLLKYYRLLPHIIPIHFNAVGVPDGYGSKSSIFILPIIAFIMYFFLTILSRFPNIYNYPKPITEENAEYQYRCARQLMITMKTEIMTCFTYIEWTSAKAALGKVNGLGLWFLLIFLVVIFGTLGIYIKKALK